MFVFFWWRPFENGRFFFLTAEAVMMRICKMFLRPLMRSVMSLTSITKKALASALKDLMSRTPYAKISVSDICELCEMNRKSFYYHFKDKEDLVNWIFDVEFVALSQSESDASPWEGIERVVEYFYENRSFYKFYA